MAARFCSANGIIRVAAGCAGLTILSHYLSPPGGPQYVGSVNTGIALAAIGLTTILAARQNKAEASLREHSGEILKLNKELARRAGTSKRATMNWELFLFRLPRSSRAASPCGRVLGAVTKTGVFVAIDEKVRRFVQTILEFRKKNGKPDRRFCWRSPGWSGRDEKDAGEPGTTRQRGRRGDRGDTGEPGYQLEDRSSPVCYCDRSLLKLVMVNLDTNGSNYQHAHPSSQSRLVVRIGKTK